MKKFKTPAILLCLIALVFHLNAQSVYNGNFENWTKKVLYEYPTGYFMSGLQLAAMGAPSNVTKTTDKQSGNYAIKMETVVFGNDTIAGAIIAGKPGNFGLTGIPFTERPTSLDGYAKYNIKPGDSAAIMVIFLFQGNIIGAGSKEVSGIQPTYTQFSIPIIFWVPLVNPDTMIMLASSSSLNGTKIPGSVVLLDHLQFIGSTGQLPNNDFEVWEEVSYEEPDGWLSANMYSVDPTQPSVTKTTDCQNGNYAVKITNVEIFGGGYMGFLTNGNVGDDGPFGGMPVFNNPDKIKFYYKYIPNGPDTAIFFTQLFKWDNSLNISVSVETKQIKLPPTPNYTFYEVSFDYNLTPSADTMNISFASGNLLEPGNYIGKGSSLYVDNITVTYKSSSVEDYLFGSAINVYPNPCSDKLRIDIRDLFLGNVCVTITDQTGKTVLTKNFQVDVGGQTEEIDISGLNAGNYVVSILSSKYRKIRKITIK